MSNENTTPLNAIPLQPGTPPQPTNTTTRNTASISVPVPASAESTGETDANVNADPSADAEDREASPPLPERHTPVTPGPRAARLQDLFATTLRHTVDKVSRDNFAACFPTVAAKAPGTLEFVQRQMVERLKGLCQVFLLFSFFLPFCMTVLYELLLSLLYYYSLCVLLLLIGYPSNTSRFIGIPRWITKIPSSYQTCSRLIPIQSPQHRELTHTLQKEFDNILTARNVVPKLNELEALLSDAALRKHAGGDAPIP